MNKLTIAVIAVLTTGCASYAQDKPVEYIEEEVRSCHYDDSGEGWLSGIEFADFFDADEAPYKSIKLTESELPTKAQWYHRPKPKPTEVAGITFKINEVGNTKDSASAEEWVGPDQRGDGVRYLNNLISTGNIDGKGETYTEWYDNQVDERKYRKWLAKEAIENNDSSNWKCQMVTRKRPNTPLEMPQEWLDQWPDEGATE